MVGDNGKNPVTTLTWVIIACIVVIAATLIVVVVRDAGG